MSQIDPPQEEKLQILKEKYAQIPPILESTGIDCWMIFVRETSVSPDSVMDLVVGNDIVLPTAFIFSLQDKIFTKIALIGNIDADNEKSKGIWDEVIVYEKKYADLLLDIITKLDPKKIALNYSIDDVTSDGLSHGMFLVLQELLPSFTSRFVSAKPIVTSLRGCKSPTELKNIRIACELTEKINQKLTDTVKIGDDELQTQEQVWQWVSEEGLGFAWQKDQNPATDAGPDKDFGHVGPQRGRIFKAKQTMHNDFGVKYHGYCSDLQRMWFFGKKEDLPEELAHAMTTIVTAIQKAAVAIKPGMKGYEIDLIAREYLIDQGYSEYLHGLGHQVGRVAHDGGTMLGPRWDRYGEKVHGIIQENQVFTLEPSLKTKHFGMVSMEEMIIVTASGAEFIVPPQQDFHYITNE